MTANNSLLGKIIRKDEADRFGNEKRGTEYHVIGVCDGSQPLDVTWWTARERDRFAESPVKYDGLSVILGVARIAKRGGRWRYVYLTAAEIDHPVVGESTELPPRPAPELGWANSRPVRSRRKEDVDQQAIDFDTGAAVRVRPKVAE